MKLFDGHGSLTDAERNPSLASRTRRNYRRNPRREPIEARYRRLKKQYDENPPSNLRIAVLDCYFLNGLTLQHVAEILQITEEDVCFEIDILRQQAE